MKNKGLLIVVSGPSGAGKGTICKTLVERNSNVFLSVSATTRLPRTGEIEGENYFFKTGEQFKEMIANDELLEWAVFCNNYYGTPKKHVYDMLDEGKNIILEIEVQGALKVRSKYPEGIYIFVLPPSMEELKNRITNRGTEKQEVINERLNTARLEFTHINKYNYIVMNDTVDDAVNKLESIITAETCRVERSTEIIKEVCDI
ncbi:guanylate kinase [Petroclostridium sp. X23]|jgi:guanylate kinase|uniref:guanylate kinase n=1 Tax=Petroclostridium sp. X23 TaxID=3045146 RepID=UPI0024AE33F0|nr:guanylate kinase [Petroclostridium sp. X23]WHH59904.1 guanylate kinase [Petroclostridium sp. X23]